MTDVIGNDEVWSGEFWDRVPSMSARAWADYVRREAAFYCDRLHRLMHEVMDEIIELEEQLHDRQHDLAECRARHAEWSAFAAGPGSVPAPERQRHYRELWERLPFLAVEAEDDETDTDDLLPDYPPPTEDTP